MRPASAPLERGKKRLSPSAKSSNHPPPVLVPSLANVSNTTVNGISRAELEAWATLSQNTRRSHESRPTVTFGRARPNSAGEHHCRYSREGGTPGRGQTTRTVVPRGTDMHISDLKQVGPGQNYNTAGTVVTPAEANGVAWSKQQHQRAAQVSSMPVPSAGKCSSGFRGTADGAHNRRSSYHDRPGCDDGCGRTLVRDQHLDGRSMGRAERDEAGHQRENHEGRRSDISVRCVALHSQMHQQFSRVVQHT